MDKTEKQAHIESCLNCSHSIQPDDSYCSHCGQMARSSRISIWRILSEFFSNVFNIDSRFFKSLRFVFLPSRLPKEYMDGKRRSYINPARFFFVTLVLHFAVLALLTKNQDLIFDVGFDHTISENALRLERVKLAREFDSLSRVYHIEQQANLDSIKSYLFEDTIRPQLGHVTYGDLSFDFDDPSNSVTISNYDILVLEPDSIISKYGIEDNWQKFQLKQTHKVKKNPKAAFQFLLGNALWVIILITISSAFFLKILYIRRKFYLVDHLVVSMYYHAVILIILTLFYLSYLIFSNMEGVPHLASVLGLLIPLYGYLSLKRYYKQGRIKTLIKFFMLGFFELIMLVIFASFVVIASVMLF